MPDELTPTPTTATPPATPPPGTPAPAPAPAPATPPAASATDPDAGAKTALESERAARREADTARKAAEKQAADANAELEKFRTGQLSESEKAIKAARDEGAAEVTTKMNARILESEIKVAAAGKLADPADAVKLIDAGKFTVKADGSIDGDIAAAIDALVAAKPYLAVGVTPTKPGPVGGGPQGAGTAITRADLEKMTTQQIMALDPKLVDAAMAAPY